MASLDPCRSYGVLIWELVSGQDIVWMHPPAITRRMHVRIDPCQCNLSASSLLTMIVNAVIKSR